MKFNINTKFNCSSDYKKVGKSIEGVADFESCATDPTNTEAKVWASGLMFLHDLNTLYTGNSIEMFMNQLRDLPFMSGTFHFHNLGFDIQFILPWLIKQGFTHVGYKYKTNTIGEVRKERYVIKEDKTFELIFGEGQYYQLKINWYSLKKITKSRNKKTGKIKEKVEYKMKTTTLQDSFKKVPTSLEKIATDFLGLPKEEQKGSIDYELIRPDNYDMTQEEKEYLFKDCNILGQLMKKLKEEFEFTSMTTSSQAFNEFLNLRYKAPTKTENMEMFRGEFPLLTSEYDSYIRKAYRGGWTYVNPKYQGDIKNLYGKTYDVNSLYPSMMYHRLLPYGEPILYKGKYKEDEEYPLFIQKIEVKSFDLKDGKLPMIQIKDNPKFKGNEYLINNRVDGKRVFVELTLTNVDLQMFLDSYKVIGLKYVNGFKFKGKKNIFKEYIDHFIRIKKNAKGALRQFAKLMLNSLYGKFASRCLKIDGVVQLDKDDILRIDVNDSHDGVVSYIDDSFYTPLACFITAYARQFTISGALENLDKFMYADTDSLHLHLKESEVPKGIDIDTDKTGDLLLWDLELIFPDSKFLGQKRYMEYDQKEQKWEVKCCGLGKNAMKQIKTKDDFCYYDGKGKGVFKTTKKKKVKNGCLILPTEYKLTENAFLGLY